MKTHKVIDNTYHKDEYGHDCFCGTYKECVKFKEEQNTYGLDIVSLTKEEIIFNRAIEKKEKINKWRFEKEFNIIEKSEVQKCVDEGTIVKILDLTNGEDYTFFEETDSVDNYDDENYVFGVEV